MAAKRHTVVCQEWIESERGWGCRPDGATFHLTVEDKDEFIKVYWAKMPKETPDEYSRPDFDPIYVDVDDETFARLNEATPKHKGMWIWEMDYSKLRYPNGWTQGAKNALNPRKMK